MQSRNSSMITADEYQEKARETAIYPEKDALPYLSLGLVSEAGEVAGKVKKLIRDGTQSDVASEIGDVLPYFLISVMIFFTGGGYSPRFIFIFMFSILLLLKNDSIQVKNN